MRGPAERDGRPGFRVIGIQEGRAKVGLLVQRGLRVAPAMSQPVAERS